MKSGGTLTYVRWTERDINGLNALGMAELLTEVAPNGQVLREIGLNSSGEIVHVAPTARDNYGQFDLQQLDMSAPREDDLNASEFEALWVAAPSRLTARKPGLLARLRSRLAGLTD